jgi:hypothetical protein
LSSKSQRDREEHAEVDQPGGQQHPEIQGEVVTEPGRDRWSPYEEVLIMKKGHTRNTSSAFCLVVFSMFSTSLMALVCDTFIEIQKHLHTQTTTTVTWCMEYINYLKEKK